MIAGVLIADLKVIDDVTPGMPQSEMAPQNVEDVL